MTYRLFRRQFVVARAPLSPGPDWRHRDLPDGWVLSHQQDLDLAERTAPDGRPFLVIGNAFALDAPETGGGGRYVLLDWPWLYTDGAGALLSLFHGAGAGGFAVASSPGLVALALEGDFREPDLGQVLGHRTLQNYVPTPGSRYRGIRRLLRDQRIHLPTQAVERHAVPIPPFASYQAAVEAAGAELRRFAGELGGRARGTIYLQLTAGMDSRTIVAAFRAAGVAFETVTLRSRAKPETDITVARAISRQLGLRHTVMEVAAPPDPAAMEIYWRQTSGGLNDWDYTDLFPGRIYRFLAPGDFMIGGACFELGRQKFAQAFEGLTLQSVTGAELWRRLARAPGPPELAGFLDDWLAWRRADPYPFGLIATHYLDQRLGAWAATGQSGFDLLDGVTLHPANNRRIFAALVTPDAEAQAAGRLQADVIRALAPELLDFPVNPVPLGQRVRRLARSVRRTIRSQLAPATPPA